MATDPLLVAALRDAMAQAAGRGTSEDEIEQLTEVALAEAFREIARIQNDQEGR